VEGNTPPERPELPGLAVRLESAERFVAATGAVVVHGRVWVLIPVTGFNIRSCVLNKNSVSGEGGLVWPSNLATFLGCKRLFLK
jgi:hypothetical protein